jgi:hypothetical protein
MIKICLKKSRNGVYGYELDSCGARYGLVAGSSKNYNVHSSFIKGCKFQGQLTNKCQIFKEESCSV